MTKAFSIALGVLLLFAGLFFTLSGQALSPRDEASPGLPLVQLGKVEMVVVSPEASFSAITLPLRQAELSFSLPGRLDFRSVSLGEQVLAGQRLAGLASAEFENAVALAAASVAELELAYSQAKRDYQRLSRLEEGRAVDKSSIEQAENRSQQLKAALSGARVRAQEARRLLAESVMLAPFSGVVAAVYLEPEEWAAPGRPVLALLDDSRVKVEFELPEHIVGRVSKGQSVELRLPFVDEESFTGVIDHIASATKGKARLFPASASFSPDPRLRAGMTARLLIELSPREMLRVPLSSVVNPGGQSPSVFVVEADIVRKRPIRVESIRGADALVSGEINAGEQVVVSGHKALSDGSRVRTSPL